MQNNNLGQYPVPEEKIKALEEGLKVDKKQIKEQINGLKFLSLMERIAQFGGYGFSALMAVAGGKCISLAYSFSKQPLDENFYTSLVAGGLAATASILVAKSIYEFGKDHKKTINQISNLEKKLSS